MVSRCIVGQKVRRVAGSSTSLSSFDSAPFSALVVLPVPVSSFCGGNGGSNRIVSLLSVPALVFTSADRSIRFSFPARVGAVKDAGWTCEIVRPGTRMRRVFSDSVNVGLVAMGGVGMVDSGWAVVA